MTYRTTKTLAEVVQIAWELSTPHEGEAMLTDPERFASVNEFDRFNIVDVRARHIHINGLKKPHGIYLFIDAEWECHTEAQRQALIDALDAKPGSYA